MTDTIEALWRAIDAAPADGLLRGILADALDERNGPGDADTAAGLRATKYKVPQRWSGPKWTWFLGASETVLDPRGLTADLFAALTDGDRTLCNDGAQWRDYHSARAAIADLVAAWVAVEREKERKPCERCGGQWSRSGGDPVNPRPCPACKGSGKAAPAEAHT